MNTQQILSIGLAVAGIVGVIVVALILRELMSRKTLALIFGLSPILALGAFIGACVWKGIFQ